MALVNEGYLVSIQKWPFCPQVALLIEEKAHFWMDTIS